MSINFLLFDAARLQQQLHKAKAFDPTYLTLYKGRHEEDLADVGPYLCAFEPGSEFASWYNSAGWGNSWGVLIDSTSNFEALFIHFQRFLLVKKEDGKELYFRFYDPRVLRVFLPTCDNLQLIDFFGPVTQFICEDENPDFALIFSFNGKKLITDKVSAATIFLVSNQAGKQASIKPSPDIGNVNQQEVIPAETKPRRRFFY